MVHDGPIFPFLDLATEIRLQIYREALPYSQYEKDFEKFDCPVQWHPGKCPSILSVNRQIHREAAEMLYRDNIFAIYARHPRDPRLPMNESRADPESFVLISWAGKSWSNPKNPRIPCSLLGHHPNFPDIRRLHVSLPPLDGLLGVDVYMQKSSHAAFNGINAWIRKCSKQGGYIDDSEKERMRYIQQMKTPIDEIALLLHQSRRVDELHVSLQARERELSFAMYMFRELIALPKVTKAHCMYIVPPSRRARDRWVVRECDLALLRNLENLLESPLEEKPESYLPNDMIEMFGLLQSIRAHQQLDIAAIPDWVKPMPE